MMCILPLILVRLYLKSRGLVGYRKRINERMAMGLPTAQSVDIWIHAVSFGEVNASAPLVSKLLEDGYTVLFTTMTPTGSEQVINLFGDKLHHCFVPYDIKYFVNKYLKLFSPKMLLIMETELWPNLIYYANKKQIPVLILNARISDKAFPQYIRFKSFFKPTINNLHKVLAQSPLDSERFKALGARDDQIVVAGNLKFDLVRSDKTENIFADLKVKWGAERPVFLAASTHKGEEQQILNQLIRLKKEIPHLLLVIAPRHPNRFDEVFQLSQNMGFITACKSRAATITEQCDVLILDTMGELKQFYACCDFAFVGGSLVPVGGHNVLEPMMYQVPVFTGPYTQNSKSIISSLVQHEAIKIGKNVDDIVSVLIQMSQQPDAIKIQVENATQVLIDNEGSLQSHLNHILPHLNG